MGKRWLWLLSSPRYLTSETLTPNPTAHSSQAMEPWCLQPDLGFPLLTREGGRVKRIAQIWKETYWFLVPERVGNQSFTHVHLRFKGRLNWWLCL